MSGAVIDVIPRRTFDFSTMEVPGDGTNQLAIVVAERLDVSTWSEATLMVRVHASTSNDFDSILVVASPEAYTPEAPFQDFVAEPAASVAINQTVSPPAYLLAALTLPFGPMIRISVVGLRPSGGEGPGIQATLSIALSVKT